jgi:capsular exopolysaccharide synthesis family protein
VDRNGAEQGAPKYPVPQSAGGELIEAGGYHYPDYPATYYGGAAEPPEGTDWVRVGKLLWQRRWWIFAAVLLGTAGGYVASRRIVPQYRAATTVWIQQDDDRSGPIRSGNPFAGEGFADVFSSRAVVQPIVESRQLYLTVSEPTAADASLMADFTVESGFLPGLYALSILQGGRWTLSRNGETVEIGRIGQPVGATSGFRWVPSASSLRQAAEIRFHAVTPQQAALQLRRVLDIRYNPNSQIITARLEWPDPVEAADILNALADQFLATATNLKAQKIRQEVELLEEQTRFTQQRLESAEIALQQHRIEAITLPSEPTPTVVPGRQAGAVAGVVDPVFNTYFQRKLNADQLEADLRQIDESLRSIATGNPPNTLAIQLIPSAQASVELGAAIDLLTQLQVERRALLTTLTDEHPQVVELSSQIEALERISIPGALRDIRAQLSSQLDVVQAQIESQTTELRQIPARTIEGARRQREVAMAEDLHNMLLVRLKGAELAEATSGPGIQILDRAWPPASPISNSAPRIILLFSMVSLGVGVAGILLHDHLDKSIRYPDQVTTGLGLPVLGVVPRLGKGGDKGASAAVAIESFRGLRTQIASADGRLEGVHLVTSPSPQEGKSLISANLAISYATAGFRTVLVDGDTRRGRSQEMFNLSRSPGLTDFLMGTASFEDVQQTTEIEHLTLIARGHSRGFNADLLDGDKLDGLIDSLRDAFEVVVVDAPPLAAGADVLMLGRRCDKVVLVLRAGSTNEELARAKLTGLGNVQLPIIGAVLNAMPESTPYYDRYVHYYYADAEPVA